MNPIIMSDRIWLRDGQQCNPGEPGAVPYDRSSSKETPLGRVERLAAALNAALTLVPDHRIQSHGTRVEVRPANGQYHDQGLDCVAEFHTAFDAHLALEPRVPPAEQWAGEMITSYQAAAAGLGEKLKDLAQTARERGDEGGALSLIRLQLIQEELAELALGILHEDIVECFDALVDLSYVVDGTYLTFGLGHYKLAGIAEVHRSNMSKLGPDGKAITSSAGRVVKGPNYQRPDLAAVLALVTPEARS